MELRQLEYVSCIARHRSISGAAAELFVTRQALSKALRSFEQEMGGQLFDREKGMRPTPFGIGVISRIDTVLDAVSDLRSYAESRCEGVPQEGSLSVAFSSFPLDYLFFHEGNLAVRMLDDFLFHSPSCRMERYALSDTAILSALVDGVIDVGFVHGEYESDELRFVPYSKVDMRVLALKGNPICAKAPLRISDLREIPIRSPLDFDLFTKHFIARCKACGFDPLYCEVSLNDDAIEQFMAEGGVHIQPYDPRMKKAFPEMEFMSFHPDDKDDLPLCLAYSARCDNRFAQKFVKYFKDNVRRAIRHSADS